jgi:two-component system C4-dicarboxylate transport sensor histidine kinase DctB
MALIAAGSTLHLVEQRGIAQETDAARTDMQMRAALITSEIARFRLLPIALADDRDVVAAIKGDGQAREALDRKLESLVRTTGAPNIYVVGTDGRAIAASNWRSPQSFVGSDYSNRRYVRDALVRGDASNFAMGSVSRRPGLYIAQRTEAGGVVVIKLEFDRIEAAWAKGDGVTFVTDADGIVLVSSRSEWRFMLTRPIPKAVLAAFGSDAMLPPLSARTVPVDFNKGQAVLDGRDMILVGGNSPSMAGTLPSCARWMPQPPLHAPPPRLRACLCWAWPPSAGCGTNAPSNALAVPRNSNVSWRIARRTCAAK